VRRNRAHWDQQAAWYAEAGERAWAQDEPTWGVFQVPESRLGVLPEDLAGRDAIELGCGTAYVSAWLARRGARPVGIDNSEQQLATARRLQREHGLAFPLLHGNAETVPLPDASFDLAISEYGACLWADPYRWVPEAARLLRPGGRLIFLCNSYLMALCTPPEDGVAATDRLLRPSFGLHRLEWPNPEDDSVEFHLSHGEWIRVLRSAGFEIEALLEVRPPEGATTRYPFVTLEWARQLALRGGLEGAQARVGGTPTGPRGPGESRRVRERGGRGGLARVGGVPDPAEHARAAQRELRAGAGPGGGVPGPPERGFPLTELFHRGTVDPASAHAR
jgi:SAM-dependent methyltransferase